jgi:hypothetical protein
MIIIHVSRNACQTFIPVFSCLDSLPSTGYRERFILVTISLHKGCNCLFINEHIYARGLYQRYLSLIHGPAAYVHGLVEGIQETGRETKCGPAGTNCCRTVLSFPLVLSVEMSTSTGKALGREKATAYSKLEV